MDWCILMYTIYCTVHRFLIRKPRVFSITSHCLYIYIYAHPPPGPTFFLFHWLFHCKVNHLLSAICQKNNNNTNTRRQNKTKTKKQQCIGEPSPLPRSQRRSPKTFFFLVFFLFLGTLPFQNPTQNKSSKMFVCLFFLVWGRGAELIIKLVVAALIQINQDLSKPNLIHLASKASCVYHMHPSQTIIKQSIVC